MKLGMARVSGGPILCAQTAGGVVDLSQVGPWKSLLDVIEDPGGLAKLRGAAESAKQFLSTPVAWAAPIRNPPKFLLLAGNFRAHVVESGFAELPADNMTPQFFSKPAMTIIGSGEPIPLTARNTALDYEAELAVVIGRQIKRATLDEAQEAIWGYTIVNDISERKINETMSARKVRQNDQFFDWLTGKWFDGSAPMGPFVLTADEVPDAAALVIRGILNGKIVQEAPAAAMVHGLAEAISYVSEILTLERGDVISMGTPAGVGSATGRFLQDGDLIECEVPAIGRISNRVMRA